MIRYYDFSLILILFLGRFFKNAFFKIAMSRQVGIERVGNGHWVSSDIYHLVNPFKRRVS